MKKASKLILNAWEFDYCIIAKGALVLKKKSLIPFQCMSKWAYTLPVLRCQILGAGLQDTANYKHRSSRRLMLQCYKSDCIKVQATTNNIINFVVTQNRKAKNTHACLTLLLVSPNSGNGGWSFGSKLDLSILISAGLYRTPTRRTCKQRWACLYNQMISGVGVAMRCINLWPSAEASMASLSASRRLLQAAVRLHGRVTPQKVRWRVSYASHIFIKL